MNYKDLINQAYLTELYRNQQPIDNRPFIFLDNGDIVRTHSKIKHHNFVKFSIPEMASLSCIELEDAIKNLKLYS